MSHRQSYFDTALRFSRQDYFLTVESVVGQPVRFAGVRWPRTIRRGVKKITAAVDGTAKAGTGNIDEGEDKASIIGEAKGVGEGSLFEGPIGLLGGNTREPGCFQMTRD